MAKIKYYYDPKTLSYRRIEKSWQQRAKELGIFVGASSLFGLLMVLIAYQFVESPEEKRLNRELSFTQMQYGLMSEQLDQISDVLADLQERDDNIYRVIFEADPIPNSIREAGFGGANRYKNLEGYGNSELVSQTAEKLDVVTKQLYVQSRSFDDVIEMARNKSEMLAHIPAIQPVANKDLKRIASGFGYRIHPIYKVPKMHAGIDFTAATGTPIYATGDGKVLRRPKRGGSGYGKYVVIDHGYGYESLYAHMSVVNVRPGQTVKRGEIIGRVGNTGLSTAPHLHYEVHRNGKKINPINFFFNDLSPEEYEEIIQTAERENQSFD
ncbi:MAG: Murein DD-endopeptidase MepM [Flavobacteriia bacterium]|nr:MAG: Murein DD-endopeptidase MepM [Flavobacteriia bacterium]